MSENIAAIPFDALMREVAELIVEALNLDLRADAVVPDEPLYGEGLGLDSIAMASNWGRVAGSSDSPM